MHHHPKATRMADVMRVRAASQGHCSEADLNAAGFDDQDIKTHAQAAAKLAAKVARKVLQPVALLQRAEA